MDAVSQIANQAIPKGYKQTDVGVIPEDWEVSTLRKIADVIDSLHKTPNFSDNGYSMVRVADIRTGNLNLEKTLNVNQEVFLDFTRNYKPVRGDIVLSRVGSYGVSSYVDTNEPFCMGQNTVVINSKTTSKYLYYILNSLAIKNQIENGSYGSGYKSLSLKNINDLKIVLPTSAEQTIIANALTDVDALLSELEKLIAKKQAIKTATMQQLLTGKTRLPQFSTYTEDTPEGKKKGQPKGMKASELGEIPEDWEVKTYGEVFSFLTTATNSRSDLSESGDVGYIHYGDIHTKWDNLINIHKANIPHISKEKITSAVFLKEGDILMADASEDYDGIGKSIEVRNLGDKKVISGLHTFLLRDKYEIFENGFKGYLHTILSVKTIFDRLATGLKVYGISKTNLKDVPLPVPQREEQTAIAAILSDMDAEIQALEQRLHKTRQIKQGMMQELLTGKTRLPFDKAKEQGEAHAD